MKKSQGVTLPEIFEYAKTHDCDFGVATDHFRAIGRIQDREQRLVPNGYVIPDHRFVFTIAALKRAGADLEVVKQTCEMN